jgi:hypothetical protein
MRYVGSLRPRALRRALHPELRAFTAMRVESCV